MFSLKTRLTALGVCTCLVTSLCSAYAGTAEDVEAKKEIIRIGLVDSLFRDMPQLMVQVVMEPFSALMEAQTGLKGQLVTAGDALDLGQRLKENKVQLAVFHGVE